MDLLGLLQSKVNEIEESDVKSNPSCDTEASFIQKEMKKKFEKLRKKESKRIKKKDRPRQRAALRRWEQLKVFIKKETSLLCSLTCFINDVVSLLAKRKVLKKKEEKRLFLGLVELTDLFNAMFKEIKDRVQPHWSPDKCVGDIFLNYVTKVEPLLSDSVENHASSLEFLFELYVHYYRFLSVVMVWNNIQRDAALSFSVCLSAYVREVDVLISFFQDFLGECELLTQEYADFQECISLLLPIKEKIAAHLDEFQRIEEKLTNFEEHMTRMERTKGVPSEGHYPYNWRDLSLCAPYRIKQGVVWRTGRTSVGRDSVEEVEKIIPNMRHLNSIIDLRSVSELMHDRFDYLLGDQCNTVMVNRKGRSESLNSLTGDPSEAEPGTGGDSGVSVDRQQILKERDKNNKEKKQQIRYSAPLMSSQLKKNAYDQAAILYKARIFFSVGDKDRLITKGTLNPLGMSNLYKMVLVHSQKEILEICRICSQIDNYPLSFNCSHGKDRTGIIAMLLLGVCRVDYECIIQDYNISEIYLTPIMDRIREEFYEKGFNVSFARTPKEVMHDVLMWMDQEFGSIPEYLEEIGLSRKEQQAIINNIAVDSFDVCTAEKYIKRKLSAWELFPSFTKEEGRCSVFEELLKMREQEKTATVLQNKKHKGTSSLNSSIVKNSPKTPRKSRLKVSNLKSSNSPFLSRRKSLSISKTSIVKLDSNLQQDLPTLISKQQTPKHTQLPEQLTKQSLTTENLYKKDSMKQENFENNKPKNLKIIKTTTIQTTHNTSIRRTRRSNTVV